MSVHARQLRLGWAAHMGFLASPRGADGDPAILCALLLFATSSCQHIGSFISSGQPTYNVLVCALDALEACSVLFQLTAEVLQSLKGLFLLGLHGLLLRELAIVVDGARKCGERGIELCLEVW